MIGALFTSLISEKEESKFTDLIISSVPTDEYVAVHANQANENADAIEEKNANEKAANEKRRGVGYETERIYGNVDRVYTVTKMRFLLRG